MLALTARLGKLVAIMTEDGSTAECRLEKSVPGTGGRGSMDLKFLSVCVRSEAGKRAPSGTQSEHVCLNAAFCNGL